MWGIVEPLRAILKAVLSMPNTSTQHNSNYVVFSDSGKACYISPVGSIGRSTKTERTAREQRVKIIKAVRNNFF